MPQFPVITSLFGSRLGLFALSSARDAVKGDVLTARGGVNVQQHNTTADTTATSLRAYGVSLLTTISSSCVFVLDPPIPGVTKTLIFGSTGAAAMYVRSSTAAPSGATDPVFISTMGSSFTVLKSTAGNGGTVMLVGATSAIWAIVGTGSSLIAAGTTTT